MANPTTNFGWVMPTSTDLVTDLPADFAVFGQGVDTSMADLKGGTTGQILSKTSATDMDFTWIDQNTGDITGVTAGTGISGGGTSGTVTITNSMATEITAAGDIIVGTGSGTFDNLPIGTTGQILTADTTVSPYKVKWAAASSGLNLIKTSTFSSASNSSTTFDGVFTSTYIDYILVCHNIEISTADSYLYFQYRKAGATKNGTIYTDSFNGISANNAPNGTQYWNDGSATQHQILKSGPGSDSASSTTINICYTNYPKFHGTSYNGYRNWLLYGGGSAYVNDTFDGFICSTSAGTFTGTISIYGLAKS